LALLEDDGLLHLGVDVAAAANLGLALLKLAQKNDFLTEAKQLGLAQLARAVLVLQAVDLQQHSPSSAHIWK
jgi:hypothetical protein